MAEPVIMPRLTIDMEKGTILSWKKKEGDKVSRGEIVAVVFGDKVEWEVESPCDGFLIAVLHPAESEVGVAQNIAWVGAMGENPPTVGAPAAAPAASVAAAPAKEEAKAPEPSDASSRVKASPAAKRLAKEKGVDLSGLKGTGPGGRIVEADVLAAAAAPAGPSYLELTPIRKTIGDRMLKSWRNVPHFTLETRIDMSAARDFRKTASAAGSKAPTYTALIISAVGKALGEFERMRLRWDGERISVLSGSSVGVAVHTPQGLMVPVISDAGRKACAALSSEIAGAAERARTGKMKPSDLVPACITVTNLGMFGITRFAPVINHPECSIIAVGSVEETPVAKDGWIAARPSSMFDIAVDHRAIDGGLAAEFLARVRQILETAGWNA